MKKGLIIASIASVMAITAGCAFAISANKGIRFEAAKATDKSFTFDKSVGAAQFDGIDNDTVVERSVVTGVSSNIETSVSLISSGDEQGKVFDDGTNFAKMPGGGLTDPKFHIEIGLNNVTGVSVVFGLLKNDDPSTQYTTATQVGCIISIYDELGYVDGTSSCGTDNMDKVNTLSWVKSGEETKIGERAVIEVWVPDGFVYYADPLFVRSITVNWSC